MPAKVSVAERASVTAGAPASAQPLLDRAGEASDLSPRLLEAIAYVESRFRQDAVSPKGAIGMMQLMPGTAGELGVDARDPAQNAHGGAVYLRKMLVMFDNDVELAVAAYNAGPEAVKKYDGVPPYAETRLYVRKIMAATGGQRLHPFDARVTGASPMLLRVKATMQSLQAR